MKIGVVVFPGSNCDHDAFYASSKVADGGVVFLWHESTDLQDCDAVVIPGGFSYGDYLRTGAIARFSPVMESIRNFAERGYPVLGICNGFQILCESGLLPGALVRNAGLKFVCKPVHIRVEATDTPFTFSCRRGQVLRIPVAHGEGSYVADESTVRQLRRDNAIIFRYVTAEGDATAEANFNGSVDNIAGICNAGRNVVGLMPHPERASELALGSADGMAIFNSLAAAASAHAFAGSAVAVG